jgi:hypothetical protein
MYKNLKKIPEARDASRAPFIVVCDGVSAIEVVTAAADVVVVDNVEPLVTSHQ